MKSVLNSLIVLFTICILFFVLLTLKHDDPPKPLVKAGNWGITGDFPRLNFKPSPLQVPKRLIDDSEFVLWRNWTPQGGTKGTVKSGAFLAPRYLAVPVANGSMRGGADSNEVFIQCIDTDSKVSVSGAETFDEWVVVYLKIPADFCAGTVRLIGVSTDGAPDSYLGVGSPFAVSSMAYYSHASFAAKSIVVIFTWSIFSIIGLACGCFAKKYKFQPDALAVSIIGIGASGMLVFAGEEISPQIGRIVAICIAASSSIVVLNSVLRRRDNFNVIISKLSLPLFCWLALAIGCTALLSGADNGGGPWSANALFSPLSWSIDNQNPIRFTEQLISGSSPQTMAAGPWFFDDRTPLLTVLLIIPRTLIIGPLSYLFGTDFLYIGDSMAAVTILSLWISVIIWLTKKINIRRPLLFVAVVSISPFLLFNTVYTWGKLLGATYIIIAYGLLINPRSSATYINTANMMLIPSALMLGYLCHASNAFSIVALLIVFAPVFGINNIKPTAIGILIALILFSPWAYWIHVLQPNGNALTRFAIADDYGFDHRTKSIFLSATEKFHSLGFQNWLQLKVDSLSILIDVTNRAGLLRRPFVSNNQTFLGNQRGLDYIAMARTIGFGSVGLIGIIGHVLVGKLKSIDSVAKSAAICGAFGILITTICIVQLGVTHAQAYGSVLMLSISGATFLAQLKSARALIGLFICWLAYFLLDWIVAPIMNADHPHWATIAFGTLAIMLMFMTIYHRREALLSCR